MLSNERLAAIRERVERATPGPWGVVERSDRLAYLVRGPKEVNARLVCDVSRGVADRTAAGDTRQADAAFVAAARQDVPDLLAEVERLREEVERLREEVDQLIVPTVTIEWATEAGSE